MKTLLILTSLLIGAIYLMFGDFAPRSSLWNFFRTDRHVAVPAVLTDTAIATNYGVLFPERFIARIANTVVPSDSVSKPVKQKSIPSHLSVAQNEDTLKRAFATASAAGEECREKRLSGELKTYVETSQCSSSRMIAAFRAANYRYTDLIELLASRRLALAQMLDLGHITEVQAQTENQKLHAEFARIERQRDGLE